MDAYEFRSKARMTDLLEDSRMGSAGMFSLLQEAAVAHAEVLGCGMSRIPETRRTWMMAGMTAEFFSWPGWGDEILVRTWPTGLSGRLLTRRDFEAFDGSGSRIARATSTWAYIDVDSARIQRIPPEIVALGDEMPPRLDLEPERLAVEDWTAGKAVAIAVRHSDIDPNRHVNNTRLLDWLLESVDRPSASARPKRIDVAFRSGIVLGDEVASESLAGEDGVTRHRIVCRREGKPVTQALLGRSVW